MPASYLTRHRPICDVIADIKRTVAAYSDDPYVTEQVDKLCDEATGYAQSMSAKLAEYKQRWADEIIHTISSNS